MRGHSPTRHNYVVLLRRDVFVLKICAQNLRTWRPHILKGVYEVNHLVCTYATYVTYIRKDMRHELRLRPLGLAEQRYWIEREEE